ncbi:MAG: cadherin-like domain-containing protein [Rhodospirillaceae bacterium]|nr:cadherin-like domain-containing protein [Rhodospirillales bacterium]
MTVYNGTKQRDVITGSAGDDSIYGNDGNDTLNGGAGNDYINGGAGTDSLNGGAGNDTLVGAAGDTLDGGDNFDTAVFTGNAADYTRTLIGAGTYSVRHNTTGQTTTLVRVESIQFADMTVRIINQGPVSVADSLTTAEDTALVIAPAALLGNDSDLDGDTLSITSVGNAVGGTVAIMGGNVVFTPTANFNGAASFTYSVSDGFGGTATATASVAVSAVNDGPVAVGDSLTTVEDTALVIAPATLLANDSDLDGDTLSIASVGNAVGGTVAIVGGNVVFTPTANFNGAASFSYTVTDGFGGTATATASVAVSAVNDGPVAVADSLTTAEDTALVIAPASLLGNDSDLDGDTLSIASVGSAVGGTVAIVGGNVVFTPTANFNGAASFSYTVSDGFGGTATAIANVAVGAVNDSPVAVGEAYVTQEDTALVIAPASLLANDSDVDGGMLSIESVGNAVGGAVALVDGQVVFTPASGFEGQASFAYSVSDGQGGLDSTEVLVQVTPVNHAPVTVADTFSTRQGVAITIPVAGLLANDSDPDGDALSVDGGFWSMDGYVQVIDGNVVFQPYSSFSGTTSIQYYVRDSFGAMSSATLNIEVGAAVAPVAVDDTITVSGNTSVMIDTQLLLANDTDANGAPLSVSWVGNFSNGWGSLVGSTIQYLPYPGATGPVTFDYQLSNGSTNYGTARVTLDFGPVNQAPTSGADVFVAQALSPQPVIITQAQLLANDTDAEGDAFSITSVGGAFHGTVAYDQAGNIVFTPDAGFSGLATFQYVTTDSQGASSTHTVTVDVPALPTLTVSTVMAGTEQTVAVSYANPGWDSPDAVALTGGGHVVAWRDGDSAIVRVFSQTGEAVAEIHPSANVTDYPGLVKMTALPDGGFAAVWAGYAANGGAYSAFVQRFQADGATAGALLIPVSGSGVIDPAVTALQDGSLVLIYSYNEQTQYGTPYILGNKIGADGTVGPQFRVDTSNGICYDGDVHVVTLQGGGFLVNYRTMEYGYDEQRYQMFDADGVKVGPEKSIAESWTPNIASFGDGFIATWAGIDNIIHVEAYGADGSALFAPQAFSTGFWSQGSPSVTALNDGGYLLSWTVGVQTSPYDLQSDVFAQRFDAQGNAVTQPFTVHAPDHADQQNVEIIQRADGSLIAVWSSETSGAKTIETAVLAEYTRIAGNNAENTLDGGAGMDMLVGGGRADTYLAGNGSGADVVDNKGQGADGDRVLFGTDVAADQLWFQRVGDSLKVSVVGTADSVTVDAWYKSDMNHVSSFQTADGHTLADTQVEGLVQAMATFAPPSLGQTELTAEQHQALDTVIAANWQHS